MNEKGVIVFPEFIPIEMSENVGSDFFLDGRIHLESCCSESDGVIHSLTIVHGQTDKIQYQDPEIDLEVFR